MKRACTEGTGNAVQPGRTVQPGTGTPEGTQTLSSLVRFDGTVGSGHVGKTGSTGFEPVEAELGHTEVPVSRPVLENIDMFGSIEGSWSTVSG